MNYVSVAASQLDCTFESGSLCTYSTNVGYNWTVVLADSATRGLQPRYDHSIGMPEGTLSTDFCFTKNVFSGSVS